MRVFRIEDDNGNGPFRHDHILNAMGRHIDHDCDNGFPTPHQEGLDFRSGEHKCGCASMRDLVTWFPRPVRQILAREGYSFTVLEVPDDRIQMGERQVIYVA